MHTEHAWGGVPDVPDGQLALEGRCARAVFRLLAVNSPGRHCCADPTVP